MKRGAVVLSAAVVASACTPDAKDSGGKQDQQDKQTNQSIAPYTPTGWGTPNGPALIATLTTPVTPTITSFSL